MTDERPAEPDTTGVLLVVEEYTSAVYDRDCDAASIVEYITQSQYARVTASRTAVEAAARLCAITFAESRVNGLPCTGSVFQRGVSNYVSGRCDVVQKDYPEAVPCSVHAELAALARMKAGEG